MESLSGVNRRRGCSRPSSASTPWPARPSRQLSTGSTNTRYAYQPVLCWAWCLWFVIVISYVFFFLFFFFSFISIFGLWARDFLWTIFMFTTLATSVLVDFVDHFYVDYTCNQCFDVSSCVYAHVVYAVSLWCSVHARMVSGPVSPGLRSGSSSRSQTPPLLIK